ncbi:TPA_asm: maturation protein [ssRNA phage SRR6255746_1]|uniref:Maturation protein n=1 Tax=ssRNA phage SRR6255746_1 TaxID=2786503 RepID=A0A8S5L0J9_9VIRU|nr:maturation protein [ssRNA phage SRR6255746_1]DAD50955.1 TPA_asm: maturation protein [ssRNA phage SRR6255746_1]
MIDLCSISSNSSVFTGWANTISWKGGSFSLSIGIIYDPGAREESIGCKPITGIPDWKGDKPCLHYNWKGTLILLPIGAFVSGTRKQGDYLYPTQSITKGTVTQVFDIVILYGQSGSAEYHGHKLYKNKSYPIYVQLNWFWRGDCLIVHYSIYDGITKDFMNNSDIRQFLIVSPSVIKSRVKCTALLKQKSNKTFNDVYPTGAFYNVPHVFTALGESPDPTKLFDRITQSLQAYGENIEHYLPETPEELWGDLTDVAVQNAQALDINSLAYARDLMSLRRDVESILDILHGRVSMKKLADAWLSFKYGLRLTLRDSGELGNALGKAFSPKQQKEIYSVCRAMDERVSLCQNGPLTGISVGDRYNLKIYYSPIDDKFLSLIKTLMDWDILPTLQNVWDLIPYSFVVDWFTDFSRTLDRIDSHTYLNTLRVLGTIKTRKTVINSIPVGRIGLPGGSRWSGCLSLVIYQRNLEKTLDLPHYRSGSPDEFHNIVELAAIIAQKLRRR